MLDQLMKVTVVELEKCIQAGSRYSAEMHKMIEEIKDSRLKEKSKAYCYVPGQTIYT